jgi:hypothetical protein
MHRMKKLSNLLAERDGLLRQARLANFAYAYETLCRFEQRIVRARLVGAVTLAPPDPDKEHFCATLTAEEGHQSVIEEHFSDEDLVELADVLGFVVGHATAEVGFRLEEIGEAFIAPLRGELEREGVIVDGSASTRQQQPQS